MRSLPQLWLDEYRAEPGRVADRIACQLVIEIDLGDRVSLDGIRVRGFLAIFDIGLEVNGESVISGLVVAKELGHAGADVHRERPGGLGRGWPERDLDRRAAGQRRERGLG